MPISLNGVYVSPNGADEQNTSGIIDQEYLDYCGSRLGVTRSETRYDSKCDINRDGKIDILDISAIGRNFGKPIPPEWLRPDVTIAGFSIDIIVIVVFVVVVVLFMVFRKKRT